MLHHFFGAILWPALSFNLRALCRIQGVLRRYKAKGLTKNLISHLKRRTVLGSGLPLIIHPSGRNIRMPQPFLHLGNVGLMGQGVGGGGGPQGVDT
jgi:hypothetical protein